MRWKLLRRRLSVSAPRVSVRSHLPWPLRWAVLALMLGFSAALGLWAFETGRAFAGLSGGTRQELQQLRAEVQSLRDQHAQWQQLANTAESLLTAERTTLERLAQQLRTVEAEKQSLLSDLRFFERLLPNSAPSQPDAATSGGVHVRGLQWAAEAPGQLRYQMLVVRQVAERTDFTGRYELRLDGQLDGKRWSMPAAEGPQTLQMRQVARVEGRLEHPPQAVVQSLQVRVLDAQGAVQATHTAKL